MKIDHVNPVDMSPGRAFTQVVKVEGAKKLLFVSGQIGWDAKEQIAGVGDASSQARRAFENIQTAVSAAGGSMDEVVKLTIFLMDVRHMPAVREVRKGFWKEGKYPACSSVQVGGLAHKDALLEIEAIAVLS